MGVSTGIHKFLSFLSRDFNLLGSGTNPAAVEKFNDALHRIASNNQGISVKEITYSAWGRHNKYYKRFFRAVLFADNFAVNVQMPRKGKPLVFQLAAIFIEDLDNLPANPASWDAWADNGVRKNLAEASADKLYRALHDAMLQAKQDAHMRDVATRRAPYV